MHLCRFGFIYFDQIIQMISKIKIFDTVTIIMVVVVDTRRLLGKKQYKYSKSRQ